MKVVIDSIEISSVNRNNRIEAEIDFYEPEEVIKEFGLRECVDALGDTDFLNEIGWNTAEGYFSDEIQDRISDAIKLNDEEIAKLEARIAELEG